MKRLLVPLASLSLLLAAAAGAADRPDSLDDICPADADPCLVKKAWDVSNLPFAVDFGLRTIRVSGGGAFDANGDNDTWVTCGRFEAVPGTLSPVYLAGAPVIDYTPGGRLEIRAYKSCSDNPATRCLDDSYCTAGTCSVGDGSIVLNGTVLGKAADNARLTLRAAGSVEVHGNVQLSGKDPSVEDLTEAGELVISATEGPVIFDGNMNARAQHFAGTLSITTGGDVVVDSKIKLMGTYYGGQVLISAGGDVQIDGGINAVGLDDTGDSGNVFIQAGGTIRLGATGLQIDVSGSGAGSTAGRFQATAAGNVEAYEADIDVGAGEAQLSAGIDARLMGRIDARSSYFGGDVLVDAGQDAMLDGTIDVSGNQGAGGSLTVSADRAVNLTEAGSLKARSKNVAGAIALAAPTITIGRSIKSAGLTDAAGVHLSGCDITLSPLARVEVNVPGSGLRTTSSEQLTIATGATVSNREGGTHVFEYRDGGPSPVILGDVAPDFSLVASALAPCP